MQNAEKKSRLRDKKLLQVLLRNQSCARSLDFGAGAGANFQTNNISKHFLSKKQSAASKQLY